jgi:hypothetical protein
MRVPAEKTTEYKYVIEDGAGKAVLEGRVKLHILVNAKGEVEGVEPEPGTTQIAP